MCGATGEVRLDGRTPDIARSSAMAEAMAPRGPDGAGVWSQGRVALGHRRLKIIDLSEAGAQPMVDSELGLAIAWNGCIYNYQELRDELTGHGYRFFSHSDTEVLLKAYHHWGDRFVDRLYGMFAFAIVERDSGRVLLGRDRLGIKPLYLTEDARPRPVRLVAARAAGRRRRRHPHRPGRAAPLPDLPLGRAAAAHHPARRAQGAARHARRDRAGRPPQHHHLLGAGLQPPRRPRRLVRTGLGGRGSRVAAARGRAPPGRRRAGRAACCRAASTPA